MKKRIEILRKKGYGIGALVKFIGEPGDTLIKVLVDESEDGDQDLTVTHVEVDVDDHFLIMDLQLVSKGAESEFIRIQLRSLSEGYVLINYISEHNDCFFDDDIEVVS